MTDTELTPKKILSSEGTLMGTVSKGEEPRASTPLSRIVKLGGYFTTMMGQFVLVDIVSKLAKEDISAYEPAAKSGFLEAVQKGAQRVLDFKLWKSNLTGMATLVGGFLLTDYAVKKMEQKTFRDRYGALPGRDQIDHIIGGESTPEHATDWQAKIQKADEPHTGVER